MIGISHLSVNFVFLLAEDIECGSGWLFAVGMSSLLNYLITPLPVFKIDCWWFVLVAHSCGTNTWEIETKDEDSRLLICLLVCLEA